MQGIKGIIRNIVEPVVAVHELCFPKPNEITWLDMQALQRKGASNAHVVDEHNPQSPQDAYTAQIVGQIAQKMELKPAKIIIYDNGKEGAMHLNNNSLAISELKVRNLSPEHLSATIAHELTHQQQNQQSIIVGFGRIALEAVAGIVASKYVYPLIKKETNPVIATISANLIGFAAGYAAHQLTEPLFSAFRRTQELEADKVSSMVNGAEPMIEVLEAKINNKPEHEKSWLEKINTKHPSHQERIAALQQIKAQQVHAHART
jgi:hypothetical protein